MRYVCVHCDHRWDDEGSEAPRRCPACMRATGIERAADEKKVAVEPRRSPLKWVGIGVVVVLAAVAGYFMLGRRPSAGEGEAAVMMSPTELRAALVAAQADAGELEALLVADEAVKKFAQLAAGSASAPLDRAKAVVGAVRGRAKALAFVPWSLAEPRTTSVMTVKEVSPVLQKANGRAELYPLEVAAFTVAALRALDVPAQLAELYDVEGERAPLDPSGYLGYFVVAVRDGATTKSPPLLFDAYGGRALTSSAKHAVLRDTQVIGAALALRALHEVSYLADPRRALESSSDALALAGTLPSVRTVRGMVVLAGKQVEQGLQEFAAARQLRSDAARLHNLATAELMTGDLERAEKDLTGALARAPDFASAHATSGTLSLIRGEPERALSELQQAEKLAPDLTLAQWALAEYWLRNDDRERAIAIAQRALARRPSFDASLRMGVLLRQAGRYEEMRKVARELVGRAPDYRRSELRDLLRAALGPTALDEDSDESATGSDDDSAGPALDLNLKGSGPTLADPSKAGSNLGAPGPASGGPKLRLREGDEQLRLQLGR